MLQLSSYYHKGDNMVENPRKDESEKDFELIINLCRFIAHRINSQQIFCIMAFLTLGVGDALTASNMMEIRGFRAEYNGFISSLYADQGILMVIATKMSLAVLLIAGALIVYWQSQGRSYWMTNGFLISLTIGGIMATVANMQATAGLPYMSPSKFYFLFLGVVFILVEAGDFIDNHIFVASDNLYPMK